MELEVKGISRKLAYKLDKYEVEVGLLNDVTRKEAKFGEFKTFAGKQLLKEGKEIPDSSLVSVAEKLDAEFGWLKKPFLNKNNQEVVLVLNDVVRDMNGQDLRQRILNGFQAVVRNPILRGEYGSNSKKWAAKKGFDQLLMMTGQFFRNVKSRFKNVSTKI